MTTIKLEVRRHPSFPAEGGQSGGTLGELWLNGKFFCWTMEDQVRPAGVVVAGQTAIPAGTYPVTITPSPHLHCLTPRLGGALEGRGVLIHWGDVPKDTLGCVLVGLARLPTGRKIYKSREAFEALMHQLLAATSITLTIH